MTETGRKPGQPLISLTIPTFNRARYLAESLEALLPQLAGLDEHDVELLISDNCSDDDTADVVASFRARGLPCVYRRNASNVGADENFLQCLNLACGQYVWVMGDDDLLVQGAVPALLSLLQQAEVDLVFLSSFSFSDEAGLAPDAAVHDKLGRYAEVVTDGEYFLEKVNALLGLISVMLVNKNRLLATPHPAMETLKDTNLLQMGWLFPLIHRNMQVLYVWERLVAYRSFNSGGWGICEVFGVRLERIAREYFRDEPELAQALMNGVLRYWLCDAIIGMRRGLHAEMNSENFAHDIRDVFKTNCRYWVFVYPVSELPLPLAGLAHKLLAGVNKITRIAQGLWRHVFRRGQYLRP